MTDQLSGRLIDQGRLSDAIPSAFAQNWAKPLGLSAPTGRPNPVSWRPEMLDDLARVYETDGPTAAATARGIPPHLVRAKGAELELVAPKPSRYQLLSEEELAIIRENYHLGAAAVQQLLPTERTLKAIHRQADEMGITNRSK